MTDDSKNIFSKQIEVQRLINEKTQKDCADILGVSVPTYRLYEKNPNLLNIDQALKLGEFLKWDIFEFFFSNILQYAIKKKLIEEKKV